MNHGHLYDWVDYLQNVDVMYYRTWVKTVDLNLSLKDLGHGTQMTSCLGLEPSFKTQVI